MAAVNDCFSIGSLVVCMTCRNEEVEGEVLAFDHNTKMLILKCRSKTAEGLNDIYVLNLSLCSGVQVIKECNGNFMDDPQKLNLEQVKLRLRKTIQHRQIYLKSKNSKVSVVGQELYRVFAKQFKYSEVSWQGSNIQIFKEIIISPPYRVENITSTSSNSGFCNYVQRMVENYFSTRALREQQLNAGNANTSPALSPTSSTLSAKHAAAPASAESTNS